MLLMGHLAYTPHAMQALHGDDEANNEKLIRELQGKSDRTAHYVCALALVHPDGASVDGRSLL